GVDAAWDRLPLRWRLDVVIAVLVDDAVAIEDDELHWASLEMSATWFMLRCRRCSSARRLLRTAGSSAITMTSLKKASTAARDPARVASDAEKSPASNCCCATGASLSMQEASAIS